MTLNDRLRQDFPEAKQQTLKRMVQNRRVRINGTVALRLNLELKTKDEVTVDAPVKEIVRAPRLPFQIIHEDEDILVIDKPPGLLTSTVPREPRPTAVAAVREYLSVTDPEARAGLIHRLDRDASGLLVFSKNNLAFDSLKKQFFHHSVSRFYHAIVSPLPKKQSARIESFLVERADGSVHTAHVPGRGQRAITTFDVAKRRGQFALLRIKLHTGRKHQIRVHLSEFGSPVVGDAQYGGKPHKK
jgi:23S rRNA pseudouridine1911/1915/1917 synthase